ncbi:factor of DNA methylation 1-like [Quillaja saponaria]|uniref:Factor of DNA methylation 1-like n=1 Tax=Quillaja saponaria TaxID=32244 RepID=A0AAD7QG50_QUISA|nr:factor of DNA methylation 1-like [Quillaja saponaria]
MSKSQDFSDSELEDYKYRYYEDLKKGRHTVKVSNSVYRCPFCPGKRKQDYLFKELLQHASGLGSSSGRDVKEKAKHLGLERYMRRHLDVKGQPAPSTKVECSRPEHDQLFVWPWMGIVANIRTEWKDGRHVGESGSKLRDDLARKGFNPLRVHPLWSRLGHSGLAIVEFDKDWAGFNNAMSFEKSFEVDHCGKRDYYGTGKLGDKLYGWVARDDDYNLKSLVGDHLRRNGDLKTVSGKQAEDQRKATTLVSKLTNTLEVKSMCLKEMQCKYNETNASLNKVMELKEAMLKSYNDEIRRMQHDAHDHFQKIFLEHEKVTHHLEAQKMELQKREKQLQQREAQNETERQKLYHEKKMNERATLEQKKADEQVLQLAEQQKKEKEKLHKKIIELERKLDAKQALELEIERMRGALQVMKHMGEDGDVDVKKKMEEIRVDLKDKEEEWEGMEELNQALIVKERKSNDELQDARKELISNSCIPSSLLLCCTQYTFIHSD